MNISAQIVNYDPIRNDFNRRLEYSSPKSLSFKAIPIYEINIKGSNNELVRAIISKLDPNDNLERKNLKSISNYWKRKFPKTRGYIESFFYYFTTTPKNKNMEFWTIEPAICSEKIKKKILGIINFKYSDLNDISVELLAARDDFSHLNPNRKYKSIGKSLLYALFQEFKNSKFDRLRIPIASNEGFYNGINIPRDPKNLEGRLLTKHNISGFLKELDEKFDFDIKAINKK